MTASLSRPRTDRYLAHQTRGEPTVQIMGNGMEVERETGAVATGMDLSAVRIVGSIAITQGISIFYQVIGPWVSVHMSPINTVKHYSHGTGETTNVFTADKQCYLFSS